MPITESNLPLNIPIELTNLFDGFKSNLVKWGLDFNINRNVLDGLLVVLKKILVLSELPKDLQIMLGTRLINETQYLTTVNPGL